MAKLTEKQKRFVEEYLIDLNATQAAIRAGYKEKTAYRTGADNLRKPQIQEYLNKRMKDRVQRTEITQDKVIEELAAIAFAKGSDFAKVVEKSYMKPIYSADGKEIIDEKEVFYKDVELEITDNLSEDKKKAITAIKNTKFGISIETADKVKALELLGKHLGMFKDKVEVTGNINNPYEGLTKEQLLKIASEEDG